MALKLQLLLSKGNDMNNNIDITNGSQIENLVTKFFYKDNRLHYQILIYRTGNQKFLYKVFNDYKLYKETFDSLLNAQRAQLPVTILKEDLVKAEQEVKMA